MTYYIIRDAAGRKRRHNILKIIRNYKIIHCELPKIPKKGCGSFINNAVLMRNVQLKFHVLFWTFVGK